MDAGSVTLAQLSHSHHDVIDALRADGPVCWVPVLDAWVVTGRDIAVQVLRDPERFTVDDPRFSTAQVVGPSMLSLDGAEHRRHRGPFSPLYQPASVTERLGPAIERRASALVRAMAPTGAGDLTLGLAGPLAAWTAAASLGLDHIEPTTMLAWYRQIVAATEALALANGVGAIREGAATAFGALRAVTLEASADPESPLHTIARQLAPAELVANVAVSLFGGIETTEGMLANLLFHLLTHPDQLALIEPDRTLVDAAIEESLRLEPAVARVDRYAARTVRLAGRTIAAGDFVVVSLSAANRDPSAFERPHEFDLFRAVRGGRAAGHLAFVQGPHACLGAHLARLEARAALAAVLDELPGIELAAEVAIDGVLFRKARALPARWPRPADVPATD